MTNEQELRLLLRAAYPVIHVVSAEEDRVIDTVVSVEEKLAQQRVRPSTAVSTEYKPVGLRDIYVWSTTEGLLQLTKDQKRCVKVVDRTDMLVPEKITGIDTPLKVLDHAAKRSLGQHSLYILKDFPFFLNGNSGYAVQRALRDLIFQVRTSGQVRVTLILVDSTSELPERVEKAVTVLEWALPTRDELKDFALSQLRVSPRMRGLTPEALLAMAERIAESAAGLTFVEAENVVSKALVLGNATNLIDLRAVVAEKRIIVRKSGVLEFVDTDLDLDQVGGLEHLKSWLGTRARAFTKEARAFGLPTPRGALLLGLPGAGKSLTCKAIGNSWGMPVLRMDVGSLMGSLVGSSEGNMRKALKTAAAAAPCILWLDELEKSLGAGRGSLDGGTTSRVFGTFLTWMSDRTEPIFVVATANDVSALPPELLRAGRWDAIFFVDLPTAAARADIFRIVLRKRGKDKLGLDVEKAAQAADDLSGAEIDMAVTSAMHTAFAANRELTDEDILDAVSKTIPVVRTMPEAASALRDWAKGRATPASAAPGRDERAQSEARGLGRIVDALGDDEFSDFGKNESS